MMVSLRKEAWACRGGEDSKLSNTDGSISPCHGKTSDSRDGYDVGNGICVVHEDTLFILHNGNPHKIKVFRGRGAGEQRDE